MFSLRASTGRAVREREVDILSAELTVLADHFNQFSPASLDLSGVEAGFLPIVIYVDDRPEYFSAAIRALAAVQGIASTVIVVSHARASKKMFAIVDSITFAPVVQLVHPNMEEYPRSVFRLRAHWWWLLEKIFNGTVNFGTRWSGAAMFLEEDHVVASDVYSTAKDLWALKKREGSSCWGVSVYNENSADNTASSMLTTAEKLHGMSNTGYVIDGNLWESMVSNQDVFFHCRDGWDKNFEYAQVKGALPHCFFRPAVSRIRNIGVLGLNMDPRRYRAFRLGQVVTSDDLQGGDIPGGPRLGDEWTTTVDLTDSTKASFGGKCV